jgi:methylenetetrahydrofolate--tRNA-(uracil-5-)-methyltransferase
LSSVAVVGGGLAGCEAALQLARLNISVDLYEMRPNTSSPAHSGDALAQIVCSNSLKSTSLTTASGVLKQELESAGCYLLKLATQCSVPAGSALAVDKDIFSATVENEIQSNPLINIIREEVKTLSSLDYEKIIVATGPLTSDILAENISELTGSEGLHFFDAIAPTVTLESLDLDILYRAARYGKGDADYLNSAMDKQTYYDFVDELNNAQRIEVHNFDKSELFEGCKPVEEIAASGPETLAFGPMRPVGLGKEDQRPYAVIQLRQENKEGTLFGIVGFQTRLKYGEQKRIFRMIPGLEKAEFIRLGQMHRNLYIDTPKSLSKSFSLPDNPAIHFAGQLTGVEGYVESIASGLVTAWTVASEIKKLEPPVWPRETIIGSLLFSYLFDNTAKRLTPMNANFGILPSITGLPSGRRGRIYRKEAMNSRSKEYISSFIKSDSIKALLDGYHTSC